MPKKERSPAATFGDKSMMIIAETYGSGWKLYLGMAFLWIRFAANRLHEVLKFIITACNFCNTADNHYFRLALKRGLKFDNMTQEELVEQRMPYVMKTRDSYREFWEKNVLGL